MVERIEDRDLSLVEHTFGTEARSSRGLHFRDFALEASETVWIRSSIRKRRISRGKSWLGVRAADAEKVVCRAFHSGTWRVNNEKHRDSEWIIGWAHSRAEKRQERDAKVWPQRRAFIVVKQARKGRKRAFHGIKHLCVEQHLQLTTWRRKWSENSRSYNWNDLTEPFRDSERYSCVWIEKVAIYSRMRSIKGWS